MKPGFNIGMIKMYLSYTINITAYKVHLILVIDSKATN